MMICLVPVWRDSCLRASSSACCMLVPHSKSQLISGRSSGFTSRATRPTPLRDYIPLVPGYIKLRPALVGARVRLLLLGDGHGGREG